MMVDLDRMGTVREEVMWHVNKLKKLGPTKGLAFIREHRDYNTKYYQNLVEKMDEYFQLLREVRDNDGK